MLPSEMAISLFCFANAMPCPMELQTWNEKNPNLARLDTGAAMSMCQESDWRDYKPPATVETPRAHMPQRLNVRLAKHVPQVTGAHVRQYRNVL